MVGLFDSDTAIDVRFAFKEYLSQGYTIKEATENIKDDYYIDNGDDGYADLCLSLANLQIDYGQLDYNMKIEALKVIDQENNGKHNTKRNKDLKELKSKLQDFNRKYLN